MALEQAGVKLIAEGASAFMGDMKGAENATKNFIGVIQSGGGRVSAAGQVMIGALRQVGAVAIEAFGQALRAGASFIGDSIEIAGDFQDTMNTLGAVSGATGEELDAVAKKAKELGNDLSLPATSAVDAGEAMLELSKAGFTVQEAMDAAKGTLQLAAAAQIDEAKAAEITSNAINAFGLDAKDATFVVDLLAAASNASSIEIGDAAQSYQMAGAIFSTFQGPVVGAKEALVDLTTAVGILGNAGIKGSDAGTSLKQSLLQLAAPSDKAKGIMQDLAKAIGETGDIAYDAQGNMRAFPDIINLTAKATANMTEEERNYAITTIFGADASRAILTLIKQGPEAWAAMEKAVTKAGAAQELAAAKTAGFHGAIEGAKSQLETLQLTIGTLLLPVLETLLRTYIIPLIATISIWTETIAGATDPVLTLAYALGRWSAPLGAIALYLIDLVRNGKDLGGWLATTPPLFQGFVGVLQTTVGVLRDLWSIVGATDPILKFADVLGRWSEPLGNIAFYLIDIVRHGRDLGGWLETTPQAFQDFIGVLQPVIPVVQLFAGAVQNIVDALINAGPLSSEFGAALAVLSPALAIVQGVIAAAVPIVQTLVGIFAEAARQAAATGAGINTAWASVQTAVQAILPAIQAVVVAVFGQIQTFLNTHGAEISSFLATTWNHIMEIISTAAQLIQAIVVPIFQAIADFINKHGVEIQSYLSAAWKIITSVIDAALTLIMGILKAALQIIQGDWSGAWETIKAMCAQIVKDIIGIIEGAATMLYNAAKMGIDALLQGWQSFTDWAGIGGSIVDGIIGGLLSKAGELLSTAASMAADAWNAAMDALGAHSPSRKFRDLGRWSGEGFILGMQDMIPDVASASVAMTMAAPVASAAQIGNGNGRMSTTFNDNRCYQMPVYTNNTPAIVQHSFAIAQAASL